MNRCQIILLVLLLMPSALLAETNWFRVSANTLLVADWLQTHEIVNDERFYETNSIIGSNPTHGEVNRYFIASILLTNIIGEALPSDYSNYFYISITAVQAKSIIDGYSAGVRIKF